MLKVRENADLFLKYLNWGLIFLAFAILGCAKVFAIGGFSEPVDVHLHLEAKDKCLVKEFDGEKWLQEHREKSSKDKSSKHSSKDKSSKHSSKHSSKDKNGSKKPAGKD